MCMEWWALTGLLDKVSFEQELEGGEAVPHIPVSRMGLWRIHIPGKMHTDVLMLRGLCL